MSTKDKGGISKLVSATFMRGVLFMIPIAVTLFVVGFISSLSESWLGSLTAALVRLVVPASWLGPFSNGHIPGLSLILFLVIILVLGWIASVHVGRQGLRLIDHLFQAIPGVRVIYSAARKVVDALGDASKPKFQRAVLINWGPNGTKTMGFVTSETVDDTTGRKHLVVFIPTPPNPASGFITVVPEDQATDPGLTMEQALKVAMSLGVLTPDRLKITNAGATDCATTGSGK